MTEILTTIALIALPSIGGYISSIPVSQNTLDTWYDGLEKAPWSPPREIFAPVWSVLYLMMGISSYLVYASGKNVTDAFILFYSQLLLNFAWSPYFSGNGIRERHCTF